MNQKSISFSGFQKFRKIKTYIGNLKLWVQIATKIVKICSYQTYVLKLRGCQAPLVPVLTQALKMESAKCRLLLSKKLQIDRCKNCKISSIGYRFIGGKLELLHSASDCSNVEKSVGITNFLSLCQCIKINPFLSYDFGPNGKITSRRKTYQAH